MHGDAGVTDVYIGAVPAQIILACGVFGNIPDDDISRTVEALASLCAADAVVIWTRHRMAPDLTPTIRSWFDEAGFVEVAFDGPDNTFFAIGVHRLVRKPRALRPGQRLFTFVNHESLDAANRQGPGRA